MAFEKRRTTTKVFITSNFAHCPLVWMLYSRDFNSRVNSFHERSLIIIITFGDKISLSQNLLEKCNSCFTTSKKLATIGNRNV